MCLLFPICKNTVFLLYGKRIVHFVLFFIIVIITEFTRHIHLFTFLPFYLFTFPHPHF